MVILKYTDKQKFAPEAVAKQSEINNPYQLFTRTKSLEASSCCTCCYAPPLRSCSSHRTELRQIAQIVGFSVRAPIVDHW